MRLTKDSLILGNGIGALPTNAKLHVKGSDNLGTSTALLVEDSSGSDLLRVFNDGNVGIGINGITPAAKLHVKGTGTTSGTTALLVQNSTPAELFKITDDGSLFTVGFQGFTGTGAYTNFTIKNGIITAAS